MVENVALEECGGRSLLLRRRVENEPFAASDGGAFTALEVGAN